jgi:FKBP-type peptidyl-prolyl cis-trans isomerase
LAEFPLRVQLMSVGEEFVLYIPPPFSFDEFPLKIQLMSVGKE